MKHIVIPPSIALFWSFVFIISALCMAEESNFVNSFINLDELAYDDIPPTSPDKSHACCPPGAPQPPAIPIAASAESIIDLLTQNALKMQNLLQVDLYRSTAPLEYKSLYTIPSVNPLLQDIAPSCATCTMKFFFNFMPKARLTQHSNKICSYVAIAHPDFVDQLDALGLAEFKFPEVLSLISQAVEQQRLLGALLSAQGLYTDWVVTVSLPVFYQENNFFLTPKQKAAIADASLFIGGGASSDFKGIDEDSFIKEHLISDKLGLGDVRVDLWWQLPSTIRGAGFVGGFISFPTDRAFATGIYGSAGKALSKKSAISLFDFQTLVNLWLTTAVPGNQAAATMLVELFIAYGFEALNRLGANLLNNKLGSQHVAFGPVLRYEGDVGLPDVTCQLTADIAYYVPGNEVRFFKKAKDLTSFQRDYTNAAEAQANLNFLMTQATNTLYPAGVIISVHPGWTFNATAAMVFSKTHYEASIGYNIWAKSAEQFGAVYHMYPVYDIFLSSYGTTSRYLTSSVLDIDAGRSSSALEGKLFGTLTSTIHSHNDFDMRVGLRGDLTLHSHAIGRSYTAAAELIIDF